MVKEEQNKILKEEINKQEEKINNNIVKEKEELKINAHRKKFFKR